MKRAFIFVLVVISSFVLHRDTIAWPVHGAPSCGAGIFLVGSDCADVLETGGADPLTAN